MLTAAALALTITGSAGAGEWWESTKIKGDLRYRHEMLDHEGTDARHRQRIRARLGVHAEVSDYTKAVIQLATGSGDPVSTNQTLDNSFTTKDIRLDMAYLETEHDKLPGFTLTAGKFENPFFKPGSSELVWDSDWNPEGGVFQYEKSAEQVTVTLIGAGLWIDERSSDDDSYLAAAEGLLRYDFAGDMTSLAVGGAYYNYVNTEGFEFFYDGESMGNSVAVDTVFDGDEIEEIRQLYANDYDLVEGFVELTHHFDSLPVTAMFDYVTNTKADSLNTGWSVGIHVGKTKKPADWSARYIYRNLDKDAVVGTFSDSDFRDGGTDAKGHEFGANVLLTKNTTFSISYFANQTEIAAGDDAEFGRLQVDLQLKF
jgi:hypothetical protein